MRACCSCSSSYHLLPSSSARSRALSFALPPSLPSSCLSRASSSSFASCSSSSSSSSSFVAGAATLFASRRAFTPPLVRRSASTSPVAAMAEPVEVLVKAAVGEPEKIGDCPFSQRVLLHLEEKGVPYNAKYVDLVNKPDWFLEINPEGKVPVIKHEGKWVPDSDVITQIIEEKYPEPALKTPEEKAVVGSKIFPCFVKFLKSKDPSDGTEQALVAELQALDDHLKVHGPFINGEKVTAADLSLAPKLFHLKIALANYKKWSIPENLTHVKSYMEALHARESFVKTKPAEEHVVLGWQKHVS